MKREDLYRSMNNIDDEILERSEAKKKKRTNTWIKFAAMAACICLFVMGATNIFKKEIEYIAPNEEMSLVMIDDFATLCEWSNTIVKAKYIRRESYTEYGDLFVFKLEKDFIGNVDEKYICLHEDKETSFIRGKSYYLFMVSYGDSALLPYVSYARTEPSFLLGEVGKGNSKRYTFYNDYTLGLDQVEDISKYIETEIIAKGAYKKTEVKSETLNEAIMNADAIYKIKIESVENKINRYVANCTYSVKKELREKKSVGNSGEIPTILAPGDSKKGDQFIILLKYNERYNKYEVDYSSIHYIYSTRSREARYIIRSYNELNGR